MLWCVRSVVFGRVRSRKTLYGSSQYKRHIRSGLSAVRASGDQTLGRVRSNEVVHPVTSEHVRLRLSDRYDRTNEI
jgi:late competence protein required for DNA uptake (superfamily II DNA/RNA helicase)